MWADETMMMNRWIFKILYPRSSINDPSCAHDTWNAVLSLPYQDFREQANSQVSDYSVLVTKFEFELPGRYLET